MIDTIHPRPQDILGYSFVSVYILSLLVRRGAAPGWCVARGACCRILAWLLDAETNTSEPYLQYQNIKFKSHTHTNTPTSTIAS